MDSEAGISLGFIGKWLGSVQRGHQIVHERVSQSVLRVTIQWNVARYIVEHPEPFIADGYIDSVYDRAVDPAVLAEMEVEKKAAEELKRELARKQRAKAEAAEELERKLEWEKREEAEAAEAVRKVKSREWNCRRMVLKSIEGDLSTFIYRARRLMSESCVTT